MSSGRSQTTLIGQKAFYCNERNDLSSGTLSLKIRYLWTGGYILMVISALRYCLALKNQTEICINGSIIFFCRFDKRDENLLHIIMLSSTILVSLYHCMPVSIYLVIGKVPVVPLAVFMTMLMVLSLWTGHCKSSATDPVHLINIEHQPSAADPQVKPTDLCCKLACILLSYTPTIAIWYHLTWKQITPLIFMLPWRVEGWVDLCIAVRMSSLCPRLYIAVVFVRNTQAARVVFQYSNLVHCSQACYHYTTAACKRVSLLNVWTYSGLLS